MITTNPAFLASYEVLGPLGRGGMGEVLRLRHRLWELELAAKIPLPGIVESAGGLDRFRKEADTWIRLPLHPNVVTCHYVRIFDGLPVIFAEYVPGGSLAHQLANGALRGGALRAGRLEQALEIAFEAAHGLLHAHRAGVIHQDVKPSNILLGADGARLTDFGIATVGKSRVTSFEGDMTLQGTVVGMTPHYASPEQLGMPEVQEFLLTQVLSQDAQPITRATDVWSFGCTLLELFTGHSEWRPGQASELIRQTLGLPEDLHRLLSQMLQVSPGERPEMETVAEALAAALAQRGRPRVPPRTAGMRADGLNNRAVSALDLGDVEEARARLREALSIDPHHAEAVFNEALLAWRAGEILDVAALARVRQVAGTWQTDLLEAWIEIERGDEAAAWNVLDRVAARGAGEPQATRAVARASRMARNMVEETARIRVCTQPIDCLVVDERWIVTGSRDGAIRIFDPQDRRLLRTIAAHGVPGDEDSTYVMDLAISPDGKRIYSVGWDGFFRGFDGETGRALFAHPQPGRLYSLALSEDGTSAFTGSGKGSLWHWHLSGEKADFVSELLMLPDERTIYCLSVWNGQLWVGAEDGWVRIFDSRTTQPVEEFKPASRPRSFQGMATTMLVGEKEKRISLYEGHQRAWSLEGMQSEVDAIALRADARLLACTSGMFWCLWDLALRRCIRTVAASPLPTQLEFSPGGELVVADWHGWLRFYRIDPVASAPTMLSVPRRSRELDEQQHRVDQALQRAETHLKAGRISDALAEAREIRNNTGFEREERLLRLWEQLGEHRPRTTPRAIWPLHHRPNIAAYGRIARHPTQPWNATASPDGVVSIWTSDTQQVIRKISFPEGYLVARTLSFSPDGRFLAIGCYKHLVILNLQTDEHADVNAETGYLRGIAWSDQGDLVACDDRGYAQVFRCADGTRICTVRGPDNRPQGAAFLGNRLIVADDAGHLLLWDLVVATASAVVPGPWASEKRPPEPAAAFLRDYCPNPKVREGFLCFRARYGWLYGGRQDGVLVAINLQNPRKSFSLIGHGHGISDFDFLGENHLVTVSFDKTVRVWDLSLRRCLSVVQQHTHTLWGVVAESPSLFWTVAEDGMARRFYVDWELG